MTPEQLEELRRFLASGGGTNLAGQSLATDPTYSSGQQYAQQIAGGVIPNSQVIAPGVSYSPSQPGGYTQEGLNLAARDARIAELKKDLVWPDVPTTGESYTMEDQMPYAPPGVKEPTIWTPDSTMGDMLFPNIDYLQGLDFSGLPALGNVDIDLIIKEYQDRQDAGEPEPFESFFEAPAPVMPEAPAEVPVSAGLFDFDTEKPTPTSFDFDAIGKPLPSFFDTGENPSIPSFIPNFPIQQPMNFTGLPQVPSTPYIVVSTPRPNGISPVQDPTSGSNAVGPEAVAAINIPNIPMNFTGLPNIPVPPAAQVYSPPAMPAYTQPRVEDIIAPIRTGSTRRLPQPGLFNLR